MLTNTNKTKSVNILKFCNNLSELVDFNLTYSPDNNHESNDINNQEENQNSKSSNVINVLFLLKHDSINVCQRNKNELVRDSIRQNINLKNCWYATVFYVSPQNLNGIINH